MLSKFEDLILDLRFQESKNERDSRYNDNSRKTSTRGGNRMVGVKIACAREPGFAKLERTLHALILYRRRTLLITFVLGSPRFRCTCKSELQEGHAPELTPGGRLE